MNFTFSDYYSHIQLLRDNNYAIVGYGDETAGNVAVLRHDVDMSLKAAVEFAKMEEGFGVNSTYFVLITSGFYNTLASESKKYISEILRSGHEIGLQFDETCYDINGNYQALARAVAHEKSILEQVVGGPVRTISMHRPSKFTLEGNFEFDGLINSYSKQYFITYKYISDSRMYWRENLKQVICCGEYKKLHILTHPFWYARTQETTREKLMRFINQAKRDRYILINDNFRDLDEFIRKGEVE